MKGSHKLSDSFRFAMRGISACLARERNMKIHLAAAAAVVVAGLLLKISVGEWAACLIFIALVIGAELLNTAIEAAVDLACPNEHPTAKLAKDAAAGAVLVCSLAAAVGGLLIFIPKLAALIRGLIQ